jgi:hypothetical protein
MPRTRIDAEVQPLNCPADQTRHCAALLLAVERKYRAIAEQAFVLRLIAYLVLAAAAAARLRIRPILRAVVSALHPATTRPAATGVLASVSLSLIVQSDGRHLVPHTRAHQAFCGAGYGVAMRSSFGA